MTEIETMRHFDRSFPSDPSFVLFENDFSHESSNKHYHLISSQLLTHRSSCVIFFLIFNFETIQHSKHMLKTIDLSPIPCDHFKKDSYLFIVTFGFIYDF